MIRYIPEFLAWPILIPPVLESTLIKSLEVFKLCPSKGSTPEYYQLKFTQVEIAEKGVIDNIYSAKPK